jgi:flagellar protein FlgJ
MNPLDQTRLDGKVAQGLATDGRSLDNLKRAARNDPQAAVKQAAQQFEALFLQTLLKKMREAMPKSGMLDSQAGDMYTGMLDQQMSVKMAESGTGLAAMIAKQIGRNLPQAPGAAAASAAAAAAAGTGTASANARRQAAGTGATDPAAASARSASGRSPATWHPLPGALPPSSVWSGVAPGATVNGAVAPAGAAAGGAPLQQAQRAFVTRHAAHAAAAEQATGIPARLVLGQAALESGWGQYEIRGADGANSHNLFGIKAGSQWTGKTVDVVTTEYSGGTPRKAVERFRSYSSYTDAFKDWAQMMAGNPRYASVVGAGNDAARFAQGLQQSGYATDPAYAAKVLRTIHAADAARGHGAAVPVTRATVIAALPGGGAASSSAARLATSAYDAATRTAASATDSGARPITSPYAKAALLKTAVALAALRREA